MADAKAIDDLKALRKEVAVRLVEAARSIQSADDASGLQRLVLLHQSIAAVDAAIEAARTPEYQAMIFGGGRSS